MADNFDNEYYVMHVVGANNTPLLAWGSADFSPFMEMAPIDEKEIPLQIIFGEPYPEQYEMTDFLMLDADFACSEKFKNIFEKENIYGIQFIPVEITTNKKEVIKGYYAIHFWNRIPAIDKNNYTGEEPNMFGNILDLEKFSLDFETLNKIPLEKRLIFLLSENNGMIIIHKNIYKTLVSEKVNGFRAWKVSEWNSDVMFQ